jgi:MFS family permease
MHDVNLGAAESGALPPSGVWAPERRRLTVGLVLTITLVAFESLAVSTVMPVVSRDLGGLGLYGWVFSGFFLGTMLGIVTAGQAADRRGTSFPFAVGLALFSAGLLLGGLAPSMPVLVAARVAQGIGAGAIPAVAYAAIGRSYPAAIRPRVFAVLSTAWVVPGLMGPAASSAITETLGWRAVFLAILPLVAIAGAITVPVLRSQVDARRPVAVIGSSAAAGTELAADAGASSTQAVATPKRPGDLRRPALALTLGTAAVLAAVSGAPLLLAAVLMVVGVPVAVVAFLRLVPTGTLRLAPGMPAAILVRGILTFAFFGTDAYVSLTFQDVRDQPTWVAGLALTGATVLWTVGAWVQQRLVHTLGPRRLVGIGFAILAVGIGGMFGALGPLPVPLAIAVWSVAGLGVGMAYSPLSVTVLGLAEPGKEGASSSSLQLSDVLGVSLGTGLGGAFVAFGDTNGWATRSALELAFTATLVVAVLGVLAARRLPRALPEH